MVMQIQVQIGGTGRVFFYESALECWGFKKNFILRAIPKTRLMDFGLLYENDKGEYVVLNDVRMADIRLASLVYLLVYVSTYCVPIALLRQNKLFPLLCLGHAQIIIMFSVIATLHTKKHLRFYSTHNKTNNTKSNYSE